MINTRNHSNHIKGLNTIRFLAALSVCIDHERPIRLIDFGENPTTITKLTEGLLLGGWWFSGPTAVILFFVISGFCIHLPYFRGRKLNTRKFYIRRFVRIICPLIPLYGLLKIIDFEMPLFGASILWSIVCEEIYYALYPSFMRLQKKIGWKKMILIAYVLAFVIVSTNPFAKMYPSYTNWFNWIVGLPCWFLGCYLAEIWDQGKIEKRAVWFLRGSVILAIVFLPYINFHSPFGYPLTLNFFALLVFFWLKKELPYAQSFAPFPALEWAGSWSYSLYLLHLPIGVVMNLWGFTVQKSITSGLIHYAGIFIGTLAFYYLFELPSHKLAKKLSV